MAKAVVSSVVQRLGDLLIQEAEFLHVVSGKVEIMQTELKLIQTYLEDADKRPYQDKRLQTWISEIRETAYDAEDVIDTFAFKMASRRGRGIQSAFKRYAGIIDEAIELRKVGFQIEAVTAKISALKSCLETYSINHTSVGEGSSSAYERQRLSRKSYAHVVEEFTVGLDRDVEILTEQLVKEERHCDVVSILGMGGLGKTTLAKKAYHDGKIRRLFDAFAWVYVSQQTQQREIWEGILSELISASGEKRKEIKGWRNEKLAENLFQVQRDKKCLVILDDIWTTEAWDSLKSAFPLEKSGSKLLLTTRIREVAPYVDPNAFIHELKLLNEEESWELFKKKAFPREDDPGVMCAGFESYTEIENLGRSMVRRCGGLPLAIIVLAGVLATKHTLNEWVKVDGYLTKASHRQHFFFEVNEVLALSYHEMPYQLKSCFLHLAQFPEDYEIPIKKLVKMWVAEGIVSTMSYATEGEETLEDVAERYIAELIFRFMVQVGVTGSNRKAKTCRLHNIMRDLCLSKANQENFMEIVNIQDRNGPMFITAHSSSRVHRLAIYLDSETDSAWEFERVFGLRSLFFFCPHGTIMSQRMESMFESKFNDFKLLKILDLGNFHSSENLLGAIAKLIHLRYLSLEFCSPTNLPSSIGNLRCLQTLILNSNSFDIRVPDVIWKMIGLRHLYLPRLEECKTKLQLGNLSNLQTLQGFNAMCFDVKELIKLTSLKKLGIIHLESFKALEGILISPSLTFDRLCSLNISIKSLDTELTEIDLQGLCLGCPHLHKLFLDGKIVKLPEYFQFPENLTKLTLYNSQLEEDPMATLGKLRYLTILRLHRISFIGKEMVCSSKGFPQLKSLLLFGLPNLEEWLVSKEAMPNLSELVIQRCMKLKMVPDGLRFITTLRELKIKGMPVEFANRLRKESKGGEDFSKVQHVPSIMFKRRQ